ncbi:type II toxin-antitoxin system PemK/MazF family toxin [Azospirillum rugosum]|uniref:mRNA-degrading endonuclease toxin of MazEF toxin-antitoxin module n=1 Tax=Azospirillum rugosum TaxID=416170 RepID=A0ABS4SQV9_9PROT|nr:type II toxin-antitoxin system PemK/MazF family toxin [Azospirillum rugosum]MBP2294473.1 mRNA-degrading endonuclease toxin of MazEF toxin-antitoxin module [Azospirillum rugosum]MDQ0528978.1 mRNA-degrading endonuclease toxin of MazEF toxin-antitoxin module [Azospirillum rugosum]
MNLEAGQIVLVDWRDALPKEPNKLRPAIVVEDSDLFDPSYPNVILVPLTTEPQIAIEDLSVTIVPSVENGCSKPSFALAHHVTTTSKHRIKPTSSRVTNDQLSEIRMLIGISVGLG